MARMLAIALLALLAAAPAAALAAAPPPDPTQSPFQEQSSQNEVGEQPAQQAPVQQTQVADDGSIGARETALIVAGIVALIGGIWFVISRDAKRATGGLASTTSGPAAPGGGRGGSATRAARRSRRLSSSERRRRKRGRATK